MIKFKTKHDSIFLNFKGSVSGAVIKKSNIDFSYEYEDFNLSNTVADFKIEGINKSDNLSTSYLFILKRTNFVYTRTGRLLEQSILSNVLKISNLMLVYTTTSSGLLTWQIALIAVGAVLFIVILVIIIVCCVKKGKQKKKKFKSAKKGVPNEHAERQRAKSKETISLKKITLNQSPGMPGGTQGFVQPNTMHMRPSQTGGYYQDNSGQMMMMQPHNMGYQQGYGPQNGQHDPRMGPAQHGFPGYNPYPVNGAMGPYGGNGGFQQGPVGGNNNNRLSMNPGMLPPELAPAPNADKPSELEMYEINVGNIDSYGQKKKE